MRIEGTFARCRGEAGAPINPGNARNPSEKKLRRMPKPHVADFEEAVCVMDYVPAS